MMASGDFIKGNDRWYLMPAGGLTIWVEVEPREVKGLAELSAEAHDLPSRLTFLRMLKEKTIFGEHAILSQIIDDYTTALRRRTRDTAERVFHRGGVQ